MQHAEPSADHITECHMVGRQGGQRVETIGIDEALSQERVE